MKIVKNLKRKNYRVKDHKKERHFKALAEILRENGYTVRREELKRGPNWRVVSGSCRAISSELIFVDRRLEQDEQIAFLLSRILELGVEVAEEKKADLPRSIRQALSPSGLAEVESSDVEESSIEETNSAAHSPA